MFELVVVPSKTFGIAYGDSGFDPAEKQKLLCLVNNFPDFIE